MFLSLYGPDSDYYKFDPDPEDIQACRTKRFLPNWILRDVQGDSKVLRRRYRELWSHERSPLGAFAFAIELFYGALDHSTLLETYLRQYGSDLPCNTSLIDLAKMKIEESGLEWMQIAYSHEMQRSLEESLFGEFLSANFMM